VTAAPQPIMQNVWISVHRKAHGIAKIAYLEGGLIMGILCGSNLDLTGEIIDSFSHRCALLSPFLEDDWHQKEAVMYEANCFNSVK
jgi:hypothetical protein